MRIREKSRSWASIILFVWWAVLSFIVAGLMAPHWVPQPRPRSSDSDWIGRNAGKQGEWLALHVVYQGCPCSMRVLDHLRERGPIAGVREKVILVGKSDGSTFDKIPGFEEENLDSEELKSRYGIVGAPMLLVFSPAGAPVYAGGHTPRKQSFDFRDRWIIEELMNEHAVPELPVFGCSIPIEP